MDEMASKCVSTGSDLTLLKCAVAAVGYIVDAHGVAILSPTPQPTAPQPPNPQSVFLTIMTAVLIFVACGVIVLIQRRIQWSGGVVVIRRPDLHAARYARDADKTSGKGEGEGEGKEEQGDAVVGVLIDSVTKVSWWGSVHTVVGFRRLEITSNAFERVSLSAQPHAQPYTHSQPQSQVGCGA